MNYDVRAMIVATAIYGPAVDNESHSDRVYSAVDQCGFGQDEDKAELYARLAEVLTEDTSYAEAHSIIENAMKVVAHG